MSTSANSLSLPKDYQADFVKPDKSIDVELTGSTLQAVTLTLQPGHKVTSQTGRMAWMDDNVDMEVKVGDAEGAITRFLAKESLFVTQFMAKEKEGKVALTPNLPGKIEVVKIGTDVQTLISRKGSFLAAEDGVAMKFFINKDLGAGFFGGLGFIMQKYQGMGNIYLEIDGELVTYDLQEGQSLTIDQNILAAYEETVDYKLTINKGIKNIIFGGEGLFLCEVTGPGKIWLQTLPAKSFAKKLLFKRPSPISFFVKIIIFIIVIGLIITSLKFAISALI